MGGGFHGRTPQVKVIHDLEGARVAEENAESGVRDDTSVASRCRSDVNAASECPKFR